MANANYISWNFGNCETIEAAKQFGAEIKDSLFDPNDTIFVVRIYENAKEPLRYFVFKNIFHIKHLMNSLMHSNEEATVYALNRELNFMQLYDKEAEDDGFGGWISHGEGDNPARVDWVSLVEKTWELKGVVYVALES